MSKKKRYKSIEQLKSRYGYLFTSLWIIGFIVFFAYPIIQSLWYSFSSVTLSADGVSADFIGIKHYKYWLYEHASYTDWLKADITTMLYSLPIILLVSLVLALLLNQKFPGRLSSAHFTSCR